jgi:hypothetical protein
VHEVELRKHEHGVTMSTVVGEESEQQRMEMEAKAKEAADAAAREPLPPPPPFLTQQDFAQYMRMAGE